MIGAGIRSVEAAIAERPLIRATSWLCGLPIKRVT